MNAALGIKLSPETQYQLLRISHLNDQYLALRTNYQAWLEDEFGLSNRVLQATASRLAWALSPETLSLENLSCPGQTIVLPVLTSGTVAMQDRLALLSQTGRTLFWAIQDLSDYATAIRDGTIDTRDKPAVCGQIVKITQALTCFLATPGACNVANIQEILLEDFNDPNALPEVIVVNRRLEKMKATLSPVIDELLLRAGDPHSALHEELLALIAFRASAQPVSFSAFWAQAGEKLVPVLQQEGHRILIRGVAETIYRYYQETPAPFRQALETYAALQDRALQAQQAAQMIAARKQEFEQAFQAQDFAGSRLKSDAVALNDSHLIEARKKIADFSVAIAHQTQKLIDTANATRNAIERAPAEALELAEQLVKAEIENIVPQLTSNQCRAIQESLSEPVIFDARSWGEAPGQDKPFGYRYTATPTGQTRVIDGIQRKLYDVSLELLMHVPAVSLDNKLTGACPSIKFPGVKSLPLGIVIKDVYRTDTRDPLTNSHYRIDSSSPLFKLIKDTQTLQHSLETIGIPISWLGSDVRVTLQNFNNVSVSFNHPMLQLPISLISNNVVAFRPKDAALAVCRAATERIIPSLLGRWATNTQLSAGNWSISTSVAAGNAIHTRCDDIPAIFDGDGGAPPAQGAALSVETGLVLEGPLDGRQLRLAGTANLTVTPGGVLFKSAYFNEATSVLETIIQEKMDAAQGAWNLGAVEGLTLSARVGTISALNRIDALTVHAGIDATYKGCAPIGFAASMGLNGNFTPDSAAETKVQNLLTCGVQTALNEMLRDQLDCDQLASEGTLFGGELGRVLVREGNQPNSCRLDIQTANNGLAIENIVASFDGAKIRFNLANAIIHDQVIQPVIKERTRAIVGNLAEHQVIVGTPRLTASGLTVPVAIDVPEPIGRIDLGDVTIGANGQLSMKASIKAIVDDKLSRTLAPRLEAIARRHLPQEVYDLQIKISLLQTLSATAKIVIQLDPQLPLIHGELNLLPKLDANIVWDVEQMAKSEIERWLANVLPLQLGAVRINTPHFVQTLDNDIVLRTGMRIKLPKLGSIEARHIDITRDGVKINGRLEVRTGIALPLFATPPTYLVQPGVFYDLSQKEIGAIAGFTVIAPPFADVFRLDGSFSFGCARDQLCQEDAAVTTLKMEAAGIVLDMAPLIFAHGEINFADLRVTFDAETLQLFRKLFDWQMTGLIDIGQTRAHLHTALRILEIDMGEVEVLANLKDCPSRCLTTKKNINLLIGKGYASTTFDLLGLDPRLGMGIDLRIFGRDIGHGELRSGLLFAKLDAKLLDIFEVKLATPSLKEMSPDYLADVIASLLRVRLKDILNFLKKPDIRLAPAGSPGDAAGAVTPPAGDGTNEGANSGNGGTGGNGTSRGQTGGNIAASPPGVSEKEEQDQPITGLPIPPQIVRPGGNQFQACNRDDMSWGFMHRIVGNEFHYHDTLSGLTEPTFKALCRPFNNNGSRPWTNQPGVGKAYATHLDYVPLQTNSTGHGSWGEFLPDPKGENLFLAGPAIYSMREKVPLTNDDKLKYTHDLWTWPFAFKQFEAPESLPGTAKGKMRKSRAKKLAELGLNDPRVQADLLEFILENDKVRATRASSLPREVSGGFLFFQPTYEVDYEITKSASTIVNTMAVLAFSNVSGTVNNDRPLFLLAASCERGWHKNPMATNCKDIWKDNGLHARLKTALEEAGIGATSPFTRLNFNQTIWLRNDAIPSLLLGKPVPKIAKDLAMDTAVATCNLDGLKAFTGADSLRIRAQHIETAGDSRIRKSAEFAIPTIGKHGEWAGLGDQQFVPAMASFLACQMTPSTWLKEHSLWLTPNSDPEGLATGRLLFQSDDDLSSDKAVIKVIRRQRAPYQFSLDRSDVYAATQGYEHAPWNQASIIQFLRTKQDLAGRHFSFFVNPFEHTEITRISKTGNDTITVEARQMDPQSRAIMKTAPIATANVTSARAAQCARSLLAQANINTKDGDPLATYLKLPEPRNQTGLGIIQFVQTLAALDPNLAPDCVFPDQMDTAENNTQP